MPSKNSILAHHLVPKTFTANVLAAKMRACLNPFFVFISTAGMKQHQRHVVEYRWVAQSTYPTWASQTNSTGVIAPYRARDERREGGTAQYQSGRVRDQSGYINHFNRGDKSLYTPVRHHYSRVRARYTPVRTLYSPVRHHYTLCRRHYSRVRLLYTRAGPLYTPAGTLYTPVRHHYTLWRTPKHTCWTTLHACRAALHTCPYALLTLLR